MITSARDRRRAAPGPSRASAWAKRSGSTPAKVTMFGSSQTSQIRIGCGEFGVFVARRALGPVAPDRTAQEGRPGPTRCQVPTVGRAGLRATQGGVPQTKGRTRMSCSAASSRRDRSRTSPALRKTGLTARHHPVDRQAHAGDAAPLHQVEVGLVAALCGEMPRTRRGDRAAAGSAAGQVPSIASRSGHRLQPGTRKVAAPPLGGHRPLDSEIIAASRGVAQPGSAHRSGR